jgi:hypothetical protein
MIRLELDPKTPNDIGGSRPTTGGLFFIRLAEIFDVAFGNHFGIMLMMFVINNVENFFVHFVWWNEDNVYICQRNNIS